MILGTVVVVILYLLANVAYVVTLRCAEIQHAPNDRVGTAVMEAIFGARGEGHGGGDPDLDLRLRERTGPRRRADLLRDGARRPLLQSVATTNRFHVPGGALAAQGVWAAMLALPVTVTSRRERGRFKYGNLYNELLEYIIPVDVTFYTLMVAAVIVLRFKAPACARPYRTIAYPVPPLDLHRPGGLPRCSTSST